MEEGKQNPRIILWMEALETQMGLRERLEGLSCALKMSSEGPGSATAPRHRVALGGTSLGCLWGVSGPGPQPGAGGCPGPCSRLRCRARGSTLSAGACPARGLLSRRQ